MLLKGLIVFFVFLLIVAICALIYLLLKNKDHQVLARGLEAESEEEIKQKRRAEKIQNLILSMNEEYRLTCPKNACKIRRSERTIKRTVYPSFFIALFLTKVIA